MGTRNLTLVIAHGETKIAQYGQWDGYPSGQGITILTFLRGTDLEDFKEKLNNPNLRFVTDEDQKEMDYYLTSIGVEGEWMNLDQSDKFKQEYPLLSRDNGGDILSMVYEETKKENPGKLFLHDSTEFAKDSLLCEWAYVVDFDKNTFESYKGFNQSPLTEDDRFFSPIQTESRNGYEPVRIIKSYPLDNLPTEEEFLSDLEPQDEEEEE